MENMDFSGKSRHNCFLILELPYDDANLSETEIANTIDKKDRYWPQARRNAALCGQYHSNVYTIKKIMLNSQLRKAAAQAAAEYVKKTLDNYMQQYPGIINIPPRTVTTIADDTGIPKDFLDKILPRDYGIQIKNEEEQQRETLAELHIQPQETGKYKKSADELKELGYGSLYEFFAIPGETVNVRNLNRDMLMERVVSVKKGLRSEPATKVKTYKGDICAAAKIAFSDDASRAAYDGFLIWFREEAVFNDMKTVAAVNNQRIIGPAANKYLEKLIDIEGGDKERAKKLLDAIGREYSFVVMPSIEIRDVKVCPSCYRVLKRGERICTGCRTHLYVKCPSCGTENEAEAKFCKNDGCGASFKKLKELKAKCQYASDCIEKGDLGQAELILQVVEKEWPKLEDAKTVREELKRQKDILKEPLSKLEDHIKKREYYQARKKLEDLKTLYPQFQAAQEESVKAALEEAANIYKKIEAAERVGDAETVIQSCETILSLCCDYPGVAEKMRLYPPSPAADVRVTPHAREKMNLVQWKPSSSSGNLTYYVVRKENAMSNSPEDGTFVGEFSGTTLEDRKIIAGTAYFYTVFAVRSRIYSKGICNRVPAVNYSEVEVKSVNVGEGNVQISWEMLPGGAKVRVWRRQGNAPQTPDDGIEVLCRSSVFQDDGLENEVTYGYLLCVEYSTGGKKILTEGISVTATPISLPEPADELEICLVQGDVFEAKWKKNNDRDRVVLYYSEDTIPYEYNKSVSQELLERKLKRVQMISDLPSGCKFNLNGKGFYYIVAVTIKNDMAVIGDKSFVSKTKSIHVTETKIVGTDLFLAADWPQNARAIVALYRSDAYPININDRQAKRAYIRKPVYERNRAVVLKDIQAMDYYIALFAEMEVRGEIVYSQATTVEYRNAPKTNIFYSIKVAGFWNREIQITFHSDKGNFQLPDIEIYQAMGVAPIYKSNGELLMEIPGQRVEDAYVVKIPLKKLKSNTGIRAFFKDDRLYENYMIRPDAGTNLIVS